MSWRFNYPEHPGLERWLNYGERGVSSNAIVQYLVHGKVPAGFNDPADPSDFRRCELLLTAVPSLRQQFHRMAEVSPRWAALVERWGEIAALVEEEYPTGRGPRAYALMRDLEDVSA
ncbi:hypothetical protein [Zhihengliuella flava]|uniref:Uncharacterized protein n=1 Tax=Zhihengliuella flava TaxID=1285193 RepID=A0A931GG14_9MICC|nr:hypothetical protein [Zhihengliuella flava]MBG6085850.1 hypothetical protein [Zhihengliuella flava]